MVRQPSDAERGILSIRRTWRLFAKSEREPRPAANVLALTIAATAQSPPLVRAPSPSALASAISAASGISIVSWATISLSCCAVASSVRSRSFLSLLTRHLIGVRWRNGPFVNPSFFRSVCPRRCTLSRAAADRRPSNGTATVPESASGTAQPGTAACVSRASALDPAALIAGGCDSRLMARGAPPGPRSAFDSAATWPRGTTKRPTTAAESKVRHEEAPLSTRCRVQVCRHSPAPGSKGGCDDTPWPHLIPRLGRHSCNRPPANRGECGIFGIRRSHCYGAAAVIQREERMPPIKLEPRPYVRIADVDASQSRRSSSGFTRASCSATCRC